MESVAGGFRVGSRSEAETMRIAAEFARGLRGGEVILLEGELGSGKTTFVRGLARAFGIREPIRSPTFTLMHIHHVAHREPRTAHRSPSKSGQRSAVSGQRAVRYFVHADAYRLRGPADLRALGLSEYLGRRDTVLVIEWGERALRLVRHPITIKLHHGNSPHAREIIFYGSKSKS